MQQAASLAARIMKGAEPGSLSAGNYEYKVVHYRFARRILFILAAKVGNVSRPNRCGVGVGGAGGRCVHLCPPNHLLMATINCLPTASPSATFFFFFFLLFSQLKSTRRVTVLASEGASSAWNGCQVNVWIIFCMAN